MPKGTPTPKKDEISRESLIVPEEIFANTEEEATEEAVQEEPSDSEKSEDMSEEDLISDTDDLDSKQISFFEEESVEEFKEKENRRRKIFDEDADEYGYDPKSPRIVDKIFDFAELFVFTIAAVFILTTLIFRHAIVDGASMEGSLYHGEHLIISNLFYEPKVDDVVVFEDYSLDEKLRKPIVKRVIATAGDTVRIDFGGTVYVNGEKIKDEHKYLHSGYYEVDFRTHLYALDEDYTVPEGHIFVLGDNRNNSTDSRYFGAVRVDTVLGRVLIRIYPFDKLGRTD